MKVDKLDKLDKLEPHPLWRWVSPMSPVCTVEHRAPSTEHRPSTPPHSPSVLRGEEMEHRFDHENLDVYRLALGVARWFPTVAAP